MNKIAGNWHFTIHTPIGAINADYTFTSTATGLTVSAVGSGEATPLENLAVEPHPHGERLTWQQRITKPMRLNLSFDVVVEADKLSGHSKAGKLPRSKVTGHRT